MGHPIPPGFHSITPSLVVHGAAEAINFYKQAFGAVELNRMAVPGSDGSEKLGHAELQIGDLRLFVGDEFPDHHCLGPAGATSPVTIHLYVTDADAAFEQAVAAGATVHMPLADMFWGDRYGKVIDPFGHHWSIAERLEDPTPDEMMARMAAFSATTGESE